MLLESIGARIVPAANINSIDRYAVFISRCISNQYALSYTSSAKEEENHLRKIKVNLRKPDNQLRIEHAPGYYVH